MVASSISLFSEQNDTKEICLSSSLFEKLKDDALKGIARAIEDKKITVKVVDDIAYDQEALETCSKADGVILIEQVGLSLLSEIEKEIKMAGEYQIRILGAVVLDR